MGTDIAPDQDRFGDRMQNKPLGHDCIRDPEGQKMRSLRQGRRPNSRIPSR